MRLLSRLPHDQREVGCGCCGRTLHRRSVAELGQRPGVFICCRCALWAAARIVRGRG